MGPGPGPDHFSNEVHSGPTGRIRQTKQSAGKMDEERSDERSLNGREAGRFLTSTKVLHREHLSFRLVFVFPVGQSNVPRQYISSVAFSFRMSE